MDFLLAKLQSGSPKIVPLWSGWNLVQTSLQNKNIECWNRQVFRTCFKHIFSRPTPPESSQFMGKVRHFLGHQTSLGISFSQKRSGDTKLQMAQRSSCSPDPPFTRSGVFMIFCYKSTSRSTIERTRKKWMKIRVQVAKVCVFFIVFCFQVIIRCFSHVEPPEDCESPTSRYVFLFFQVIDFAIFTIQNLPVMVGRLHLPSTCFAIEFAKLKLWRDLG